MSLGKPLDYYCRPEDNPLRFHLLHVDEGLMVLIVFPNNATMLFDCNIRDDDKDDILAYLSAHIPLRFDPDTKTNTKWIDAFVNSHRDQDHYRGLSYVHEAFPVKSIWDSGQTGATTQDADYQYYMRLRRTLKDKYGKDAVVVPAPSLSPLVTAGMANVYCLCSSKDFGTTRFYESAVEEVWEERAPKIQHTNCIALVIRFGGRSILLPGDTDWKAWKEKIVPNFSASGLLRSNILVASHHGSRSFFTDEQANDSIDPDTNPDDTYVESLDHIKPSITLIPCGTYESQHHPNEDAEKIYKEKTANNQVYTTDDKGSLAGLICDDGKWTITPTRFRPWSNRPGPSFEIECMADSDFLPKTSGSAIKIRIHLKFSVVPNGGLTDPDDKIRVYWEVSNGGINNDHEHQDIYDKEPTARGGKYEFERELVWEGTHLLRCRVKNTVKYFDVTKVFVVNGIK